MLDAFLPDTSCVIAAVGLWQERHDAAARAHISPVKMGF
jgi:hypothetical protein